MADIFKPRKIPRHLIVYDEYELRNQPRLRLGRYLLWGLTLMATAVIVATMMQDVTRF